MRRKRYQSKKKFLEAKRKFHIFCTLIGIGIIALIVGFIFLLRMESMQITSVYVQDVEYASEAHIKSIVEKELEGSYLFVIPRTNTIFFPKIKIARQLRKESPSFSNVELSRNGLQELEVEIAEYQAFGTFCTTDVNNDAQESDVISEVSYASGTRLLAGSNSIISRTKPLSEFSSETACFIFNENAYVYATTSLAVANIPFFSEHKGDGEQVLGTTYFPAEDIVTVKEFVALLPEINFQVESIWTKDGEVYTIETTDRVKLHIETEDNPREMFENLKTLLENNVITEGYYKNLDYIDLRFGNRVFYREAE